MRPPRDKGRVERAVPGVRDDCFAGEVLTTLDEARALAPALVPQRLWPAPPQSHAAPPARALSGRGAGASCCRRRPRRTTSRCGASRRSGAISSPPSPKRSTRFRIPYVGQWVTARADAQIVRFYARGLLIKTHPRQAPGGQSIDASDYPVERSVYAMRNVDALRRQADAAGEVIGRYAAALLDSPLPWTRMRRVYALLGLVRRYGAARVTEVCTVALDADMLDVQRLKRMLEQGVAAATARAARARHSARPLSPPRHPIRPAAPPARPPKERSPQ